MDYLKVFNLTKEDLKEIENSISDIDYSELSMHEERVIKIIKFLRSKNIKNIKDLLINKTELFYENLDYIKSIFENIDSKMIESINEDANNLLY